MAAFLAEIAVILMIGAVIVAHNLWIAPGQTQAESRALGEVAGYYVGPAGGGLMTFLFVLWASRKLNARFVLHGLLIGIAGVVLTAGFIIVAKPEHRFMYVVSYLLRLRIGAGYAGGLAARARFPGMRSTPVEAA